MAPLRQRPSRLEVTIEHLLTHTSGIVDHFGDMEAVPVEETAAELARVLEGLEPGEGLDSAPGEVYDYRNFNYVLLGVALEAVYRRPWESVLRDLVLELIRQLEAIAGKTEKQCEFPGEAEGSAIK